MGEGWVTNGTEFPVGPRGDYPHHWSEDAERIYYGSSNPLWGHIGEHPDGDFYVPSWGRRGWWGRRLNLRRPTHWLPYLRSRLTRKVVWL